MTFAHTTQEIHHDHGPAKGWMRWVTTTNHKDIGTMYLVFTLAMLFIGGSMILTVRAELFEPGMQFVDPGLFNSMTTMHALVMVFGAVMPAYAGLANWMIPMMIGAPDMALPRMNNMSFWVLVFAVLLLVNNRAQLIKGLAATVALGFLFVGLQAYEYHHAYTELGLTLGSGIYGSTFFMLTGFHGFHVTLGAIILSTVLFRSLKGHMTPEKHFVFEASAWYWHFVDVVWLLLFVFVYWF
ncbi:MAG: cytochrome c oxidase subunit 3 [Methylococcales bacterium]